jgi:hypothetical protein
MHAKLRLRSAGSALRIGIDRGAFASSDSHTAPGIVGPLFVRSEPDRGLRSEIM